MWSPDYLNAFNERFRMRNAFKDEEFRAHAQIYYANHPVEWINDFCVTFDPRAIKPKPRLMPFIMFPRQIDFVKFVLSCLQDKESGLCEKSRDMGVTWLCCAISVWLWLYHPGTVIGWGSLKEISVDKKGDPKAIFPKIRQIIMNLPREMLPYGFKMSVHGTYMKIENPQNEAAIIGEAGDSMGRGGRTTIYFKDESAHYLRPENVEAALGDNTDVQIDISSVHGSANVFYRRRMAGELWLPDGTPTPGRTRVFIFDWRENPLKTQEWYDRRRKKAEDEGLLHIFAQEVDRDYSGSVDRVICPAEWVRASVDAHKALEIKIEGERVAGQDVADNGGDKNALSMRHGILLQYGDHWGGGADAAARHAIPIAIEARMNELFYDSIGVGVGFKSEANTMKEQGHFPKNFEILPWDASGAPQDPTGYSIPGDSESRTNEDQYENVKAQSWFLLRARFYKTFRSVRHGAKYDPAELISIDSTIPRLQEILMEMTQPVHKTSLNGKTMIDKKPKGASSPNLADSVMMCYNPIREPKGFFD